MQDKLEIISANTAHADIVGNIHSRSWKQAYTGLFPEEFLKQDSAQKRKEEFLNSRHGNIQYYLMSEANAYIGLLKIKIADDTCELSSIYILHEYCHKGYGTACLNYIKRKYFKYKIVLWTLEMNLNAQNFYEKNGFHRTGKKRIINRGRDFIQIQYAL